MLGKPGDGLFLKRGPGEVLVGRVGQNPQGMKEGERKEAKKEEIPEVEMDVRGT